MIFRPQARRRLASFAVLCGLVFVCWQTWASRPDSGASPSRSRILRTSDTARTTGTCSTSGRPGRSPERPARRRWSCSSTAAGSGSATSRACPAGWSRSAWTRGSRSRRRTIGCRRRPRFPPRCSTVRGRSSTSGSRAQELGIDPDRIAASGSSAGAGIALWIGFHDDLADPAESRPDRPPVDPGGLPRRRRCADLVRPAVHQAGHRRPCARARCAQAVLRPVRLRARYAQGAQALRGRVADQPRHDRRPAGDPLLRRAGRTAPRRRQAGSRESITRASARHCKAKLDPIGVECIVRHSKDFPEQDDPKEREFREMTEFFRSRFMK